MNGRIQSATHTPDDFSVDCTFWFAHICKLFCARLRLFEETLVMSNVIGSYKEAWVKGCDLTKPTLREAMENYIETGDGDLEVILALKTHPEIFGSYEASFSFRKMEGVRNEKPQPASDEATTCFRRLAELQWCHRRVLPTRMPKATSETAQLCMLDEATTCFRWFAAKRFGQMGRALAKEKRRRKEAEARTSSYVAILAEKICP